MKVPPGDKVRPTQDRVREALFSMLADIVPGSVWIDLFAGSGSVGLEALSRGAQRVVWIEKDPRNLALLKENQAALGAAGGETVRADAFNWVKKCAGGMAADVAFADPPYAVGIEQGFVQLMTDAAAGNAVKVGGMFIAEMPVAKSAEEVPGWTLLKAREYGHT